MVASDSDGPPCSESRPTLYVGNNAWVTAGIIIADIMGAGILYMPKAVALFGWLLGALLLVALLAMNVHVSMLLWRVRMLYPEAQNYLDLVRLVFQGAPKAQRRLMTAATGFSQHTFIFSMMSLYVLIFGKGLGMAFYGRRICLSAWALLSCCLVLPFCLSARTMGTWKVLIWINVLAIFGSIIIPLADMAVRGVEETRRPGSQFQAVAEDLSLKSVLSGLNFYTFAFTGQYMLVEIMSEMRDPEDLPKAYICISAPFQVVAFLIAGLGGYYYVGNYYAVSKVEGKLIDFIPFGPSFRAAAVCLLVHMLVAYHIKGVVLCRAVHSILDVRSAEDDTPDAWAIWRVLVPAACGFAFLSSQFVSFFEDFVGLLGASLAPISCLVIPILTYLRSLRPVARETPDKVGIAAETHDATDVSLAADAPEDFGLAEDAPEDSDEDPNSAHGTEPDGSGSSSEGGAAPGRPARLGPAGRGARAAELLLICAELLLTLVLTVFGTYEALGKLVNPRGAYGLPFDCHCEGIWNTCDCSSTHVGMESCPAAAASR